MDEPGETLERVFKALTADKQPNEIKILDVGAAKLRNTLYLLREGFVVYAVEFEELPKRMPQAKENWERAKDFDNFRRVTFPKNFFKLHDKVDIALLINVINVMPIPDERLVLLSLCREKMKKDGLLLLYNWRDISSNPSKYTAKTAVNDGYFKGWGKKYKKKNKTFHGEWERRHVEEMLWSTGFSPDEELDLPDVGNNQALVFKADELTLLDDYLELDKIRKGGKKSDPDVPISETPRTYFPLAYLKELERTNSGKTQEAKFHRLAGRFVATIFDYQLKNPAIEQEIDQGTGRVDIKFQNMNKPGFFKDIKEMRDIFCPSIFVECKNYRDDLGNPEYNQLTGRLSDQRGMFGILVCRTISDRRHSLQKCRFIHEHQHKYVVVLDDNDMSTLVHLKPKGNDRIDDYMEKRIDELVD